MSKKITIYYWIIYNEKRNSIFQDIFPSLEKAKLAMKQYGLNSVEWKIEKREQLKHVEDGDNGEDFSKF